MIQNVLFTIFIIQNQDPILTSNCVKNLTVLEQEADKKITDWCEGSDWKINWRDIKECPGGYYYDLNFSCVDK